MAVRGVTITPIDGAGGAVLVEWGPLSAGDTGEWVHLAHLSDKTVQASGTVTTFALEGSDDPALSAGSIATLTDVDNLTAITHAGLASKMCVVKQNPLSMRPNLTAGSAAFVRMVCR